MLAIVTHDILGATALFGAMDFPITSSDGGFRLDVPAVLSAPDFDLHLEAVGQLPAARLPAKLQLRGLQLPFELPDLRSALEYEIKDKQFKLIELKDLSIPIAATRGAAGAFRLHQSTLKLSIGVDAWKAALVPADPASHSYVASVFIDKIEFLVTKLEFTQSGVTVCDAIMKPDKPTLAGRPIELIGATLTVHGKRISATIEARLSLEGFSNSHIDLSITASGDGGQWQLNAVARTPTIETWTDPSGYLRFENMSVSWLLGYDSGTGAISGSLFVSGRMQFLGDKLSSDVRQWLGELFDGLSVDFTDVKLGSWASPDFLKFRPISSLKIKALDIFDMNIPSIGISATGLVLEELALEFRGGGASIRASLPRLSINLDGDEIVLALDGGAPKLNVELTVPSGIKAYGSLAYNQTTTIQALSGQARFSTPTLPGVEVTFEIGRARLNDNDPTWHPLLLLYADVPVNLPVFPGVVIQRLALGAGLNYAVDGVTGLSFAEAEGRVRQGGLPDVSRSTNWIPRPGSFTLAARAFAGPAPGQSEDLVQLYIADLTFILASDLQLAAYLKMWFQTSLADAKSARFQEKPAVVALATFDGNEPSLRLIAMSKPDGLSTQAETGNSGGLLTFKLPETRLAFEANARGMAIVLGPNKLNGAIGPLKLVAETMLAMRAMDGQVFIIYRNALNAGLHVAGSLDLELVRFSASVTAAFAANVELWGLFTENAVTVYGNARATFLVEVALHVRVGFHIEIPYGFGSIDIECYNDWDFSLRVHIDLSLKMAMSTSGPPGVVGNGAISVSVLGMSVSMNLPVNVHDEAVAVAGKLYNDNIKPRLIALGAQ